MKATLVVTILAVLLNAGCAATGSSRGALPERFAKVSKGQPSAEVRAALGRPSQELWLRREGLLGLGYRYTGFYQYRAFWVELAADGTVSVVSDERDYAPPSSYVTR